MWTVSRGTSLLVDVIVSVLSASCLVPLKNTDYFHISAQTFLHKCKSDHTSLLFTVLPWFSVASVLLLPAQSMVSWLCLPASGLTSPLAQPLSTLISQRPPASSVPLLLRGPLLPGACHAGPAPPSLAVRTQFQHQLPRSSSPISQLGSRPSHAEPVAWRLHPTSYHHQ